MNVLADKVHTKEILELQEVLDDCWIPNMFHFIHM